MAMIPSQVHSSVLGSAWLNGDRLAMTKKQGRMAKPPKRHQARSFVAGAVGGRLRGPAPSGQKAPSHRAQETHEPQQEPRDAELGGVGQEDVVDLDANAGRSGSPVAGPCSSGPH